MALEVLILVEVSVVMALASFSSVRTLWSSGQFAQVECRDFQLREPCLLRHHRFPPACKNISVENRVLESGRLAEVLQKLKEVVDRVQADTVVVVADTTPVHSHPAHNQVEVD